MSEWKPISSAPKDGTAILLGHDQAVFDGWWDAEISAWVDGCSDRYEDLMTYEPTHWTELPSPPSPKSEMK
jgi:hypothetical protein